MACFVTSDESVAAAFCVRSSKNWAALRQRKTPVPKEGGKPMTRNEDDRFLFGKRDDRKAYTADCVALAAMLGLDTRDKFRAFVTMVPDQVALEGLHGGPLLAQFDTPWERMGEFVDSICAELDIRSAPAAASISVFFRYWSNNSTIRSENVKRDEMFGASMARFMDLVALRPKVHCFRFKKSPGVWVRVEKYDTPDSIGVTKDYMKLECIETVLFDLMEDAEFAARCKKRKLAHTDNN